MSKEEYVKYIIEVKNKSQYIKRFEKNLRIISILDSSAISEFILQLASLMERLDEASISADMKLKKLKLDKNIIDKYKYSIFDIQKDDIFHNIGNAILYEGYFFGGYMENFKELRIKEDSIGILNNSKMIDLYSEGKKMQIRELNEMPIKMYINQAISGFLFLSQEIFEFRLIYEFLKAIDNQKIKKTKMLLL